MSIFKTEDQPIYLIGLGHGATHWIWAGFLFLLPTITKDFGISYTEAGFLVTIFHIASLLANIFSGPLVDITGRRVLWQAVSLSVGAISLYLIGITASILGLSILLAAIGASNNLWHPAAISYLSARYQKRRGYALSIHAMGANLGDAAAPLAIAPLMVMSGGWIPAAQLSAILPLGVVLLLMLRLARISKLEKIDTEASRPEKDKLSFDDYKDGLKSLIKNKLVTGLCIMSGLRNMAQSGMMVFLPLYLADIMGMSPMVMGLTLFLFQASGVVAAPIAGAISDKKGRRPVVMGGLLLSTILLIGLIFTTSEIVYIAGITLMGFFLFALRPVVHSWMMDVTPQSMGGSATSLMFGVQSLFAFIAPALGGILADQYGLIAAFHLITFALLAANIVLLWLPKENT